GLVTLTHTPNPMGFLRELLGRPDNEKATMIIAVGHPAADATTPTMAKIKKPLDEILTIR
ncbi:MAG: nitroreductase family protein, partial [Pseudomonadota bacterium]